MSGRLTLVAVNEGCLVGSEVLNELMDILEERSDAEVELILDDPLFKIAG